MMRFCAGARDLARPGSGPTRRDRRRRRRRAPSPSSSQRSMGLGERVHAGAVRPRTSDAAARSPAASPPRAHTAAARQCRRAPAGARRRDPSSLRQTARRSAPAQPAPMLGGLVHRALVVVERRPGARPRARPGTCRRGRGTTRAMPASRMMRAGLRKADRLRRCRATARWR